MGTITGNLNFPTKNQVPDHSFFDINGKQTYLGNSYILPTPGIILPGTTEMPLALITNPSGTTKSLFLFQRKLNSSDVAIIKYYIDPTVSTIGVQTVALVADSSGSLNSTYFLLNDANNSHLYYVWFSINNAGVDPAVPGRTGVKISGSTNAAAATLGGVMATAIAALNSTNSFTTSGTSTVTITDKISGPLTPAVDGVAATGFTFAVTAGLGIQTIALNLRPASSNTSLSQCYLNPVPSNNGTLYATLGSEVLITVVSDVLFVLDPGQSMLITATAVNDSTEVFSESVWYEL